MARRRRKDLSERQIRILDVLDDFQKKFGYPPSIRDLCEKANISSTSVVNYYLDQLEEMGYIERDQGVRAASGCSKPLARVSGSSKGQFALQRMPSRTLDMPSARCCRSRSWVGL